MDEPFELALLEYSMEVKLLKSKQGQLYSACFKKERNKTRRNTCIYTCFMIEKYSFWKRRE